LTIGRADSSQMPMLVAGAKYYPSTHLLAVADSAALQIHVYDSLGRRIRSIGRKGRGPNEIRAMTRIAYFGDTIVVVDRFNSRASQWSTAGFVNSRLLPTEFAIRGEVATVLSAGDALLFTLTVCPRQGQVQDSAEFFIVDSVGKRRREVGRLYSGESFYTVLKEGPCNSDATPMAPAAFTAAVPGGFWYASGVSSTLTRYSNEGVVLVNVTLPVNPAPVTEADKKHHIDAWANEFPQYPSAKAQRLSALRSITLAQTLPFVTGVTVTTDGGAWIATGAHTTDSTRVWYAVSGSGKIEGRIILPAAHDVLDAGPGHVLVKVPTASEEPKLMLFDIRAR
jgi:hypothetical protein